MASLSEMLNLPKYRYCFIAGCFAAGGSFFGKLPSFLESVDCHYAVFVIVKILPLVAMILCNVLNWRYFLKALQLTEQTLTATVLTSASNYIVSALLIISFFLVHFSFHGVQGTHYYTIHTGNHIHCHGFMVFV
ncbi:uncharacterized protein LOC142233452 isoform X2 [Haematobia irritans]|uniref:uncharacterized protein LOC142233452 isoform X2 n=1 Tax=Haematobia irritans TaxID=7368 RepID=UPI003F5046C9